MQRFNSSHCGQFVFPRPAYAERKQPNDDVCHSSACSIIFPGKPQTWICRTVQAVVYSPGSPHTPWGVHPSGQRRLDLKHKLDGVQFPSVRLCRAYVVAYNLSLFPAPSFSLSTSYNTP